MVIKGVNNYMAIRAAAPRATQPFYYVLSPTSPVNGPVSSKSM